MHGGYNWQFAPTWLLGIEADWNWTRLRASGGVAPLTVNSGFPGFGSNYTSSVGIDGIGSVRGRLGYIWNNSWMLFVSGGWAWARADYNANFLSVSSGAPACCQGPVDFRKTVSGWVLGGGLEYKAVGSPWIFGLEYLFYNLDGAQNRGAVITSAIPGAPVPPLLNPACNAGASCAFYSWEDLTVQTVRARLSYKF